MVGGASRGLGYAVARVLAQEGASVSIVSRDRDALCAAAETLKRDTGAEVMAMPMDLTAPDAAVRWRDATLQRFGHIDRLFVNTGGPPPGPALAFDDAAWQDAFELLLLSAVRLIRTVVPAMAMRGGGAIVVGTSSAVKEPIPNLALSNVMRAAAGSLVKTLATELAPRKIRINTVIPGRIDTARVRQLDELNAARDGLTVDEQRSRSAATIPLGRYGTPDEFGRLAAFLLSDAAGYLTGAAVQVDGGLIRSTL